MYAFEHCRSLLKSTMASRTTILILLSSLTHAIISESKKTGIYAISRGLQMDIGVAFAMYNVSSEIKCATKCQEFDCQSTEITHGNNGGILCHLKQFTTSVARFISTNPDRAIIRKIGGAELVNLATTVHGATCTASSSFGSTYECQYAYNGNYGNIHYETWATSGESHGGWIKVIFPVVKEVMGVIYWPRCHYGDQATRLAFENDGGLTQEITRLCNGNPSGDCNNVPSELHTLTPVRASFLKVVGYACCSGGANWGIREIEIWGI